MKRVLLCLISFSAVVSSFAQNSAVEMGLLGFINRNINLSYEYKLSDKFSAKCDIGYMLKGDLPYIDAVGLDIEDTDGASYLEIAIDRLKISAFSIHPQIRMYPKGEALKGLYIGPYAKYADYKFTSSYTSDVNYEDGGEYHTKDDVVFDLTGHVHKLGAGLMVGYQWLISEQFVVDMCFFGPGLTYTFASSIVDAPDFPTSRDIGEFTQAELDEIPEIFGKIDVEQLSPTKAKGTWNRILPVYRFNISVGFAF